MTSNNKRREQWAKDQEKYAPVRMKKDPTDARNKRMLAKVIARRGKVVHMTDLLEEQSQLYAKTHGL